MCIISKTAAGAPTATARMPVPSAAPLTVAGLTCSSMRASTLVPDWFLPRQGVCKMAGVLGLRFGVSFVLADPACGSGSQKRGSRSGGLGGFLHATVTYSWVPIPIRLERPREHRSAL